MPKWTKNVKKEQTLLEDVVKMVKEIKKETNITNKILASILQLSTSTIRNYLKDER